ncbi:hypothetical protein U713_04465 [Rhodobacter capsulatus YW2]|nr:hypothetical protein U713_04465 [Rhodobacter capsulatus YW2]
MPGLGVIVMTDFFARLRAGRRFALVMAFGAGLGGAAPFGLSGAAAQDLVTRGQPPAPIIVRNDLGGDVGAFANRIRAMAAAGQTVEIRGACYSACTMYLGLPGSCINRNSQFGFHRPSYFGLALAPEEFDFWSRVIAAHYPPALRDWYLREGRYSLGLRTISGAQLIDLGVPECHRA